MKCKWRKHLIKKKNKEENKPGIDKPNTEKPEELPNTGNRMNANMLMGFGALYLALGFYMVSKRKKVR